MVERKIPRHLVLVPTMADDADKWRAENPRPTREEVVDGVAKIVAKEAVRRAILRLFCGPPARHSMRRRFS